MRIRRQLPEHDRITALAAERDEAIRARDAWRRMAQGNTSQSSLPMPVDRGLATQPDDPHLRSEIIEAADQLPVNHSAGWWFVCKVVGTCLLIAVVFVTILFLSAAWNASEKKEALRLSTIEHKLLSMESELGMVKGDAEHELFMHNQKMREKLRELRFSIEGYVKARIEFDETLDQTRRKTAAMEIYHEYFDNQEQPAIAPSVETSSIHCNAVSGDARMECLRLDAVKNIDKVRKNIRKEVERILRNRQQQGQYQYNGNSVSTDGPQVDVRARAGNRGGGYSRSGNPQQSVTVSSGVSPVRKDVLPEMREDRRDEVQGIQREGR